MRASNPGDPAYWEIKDGFELGNLGQNNPLQFHNKSEKLNNIKNCLPENILKSKLK